MEFVALLLVGVCFLVWGIGMEMEKNLKKMNSNLAEMKEILSEINSKIKK